MLFRVVEDVCLSLTMFLFCIFVYSENGVVCCVFYWRNYLVHLEYYISLLNNGGIHIYVEKKCNKSGVLNNYTHLASLVRTF